MLPFFLLCSFIVWASELGIRNEEFHGIYQRAAWKKSPKQLRLGKLCITFTGQQLEVTGAEKLAAICLKPSDSFLSRDRKHTHYRNIPPQMSTKASERWIFYLGEHPQDASFFDATLVEGAVIFDIAPSSSLRKYDRHEIMTLAFGVVVLTFFLMFLWQCFSEIPHQPLLFQSSQAKPNPEICLRGCMPYDGTFVYVRHKKILGPDRMVRLPIECTRSWEYDFVREAGHAFLQVYRDRALLTHIYLESNYPDVEIAQVDPGMSDEAFAKKLSNVRYIHD